MKWIKTFSFLLFALAFFAKVPAQTAKTEEAYLKKDTLLWQTYQQKDDSLVQLGNQTPARAEEIQQERQQLLSAALLKNRQLAMEYASVPSGLQRLFMVRTNIGKDTLQQILTSLPKEMQNSPYGQSLRMHIDYPQVAEGGRVYYFACTKDDGTPFDWSETMNKKLLIIYDGLDCMGSDGRDFLNRLYDETSREDFDIIYYSKTTTPEMLAEIRKTYPEVRFPIVSDLKGDHSPMKIRYGAQTTPTCYLVNAQGIVESICMGIHPSLIGSFARPAMEAEGEDILIRGTVYDTDGKPLKHANVTEVDENGRIMAATQTDDKGKFSFKIKSRDNKISFQQTGYLKQQRNIGSQSVFHIQMEVDAFSE
ncbi:MAG: carboxypeptidase regulatory-like domain-containing protein [Bacteroidaceae bacterium]|jgi:hypothetical protein